MKFSLLDAQRIRDIIASVSDKELMPRFAAISELDVREKSSAFDVVTEVDEVVEQQISTYLCRTFPDAVIVAEEAASKDESILKALGAADLAFLIDPIDGTKNFVSGIPLFGVMVAAIVQGEIAFAAIYDPVCRDTAMALRGEGAWLENQEGRSIDLKVARAVPVHEMSGVVGVNFLPPQMKKLVAGNMSRLGLSYWLRCAAHEYRMAARGHCHLLCYNKLMPWDHAAGWLLHREAGGYSAHFDGSPYLPTHQSGGLLCAPDRDSWDALQMTLFGPGA